MTRIGSLFTGYGGLDTAVQAVLGGDVAWYSEIEPAACRVLAAHHPGVPNLGDITKVDWADVEPVDILTGGYPCQPFSHAGKRKGTDDERHLWPYVRDAIAAIRPMVAVFENVDGHRSLGLADVLADLASLGMSARWGVVRAADAGAPHGRKRVFIIVTDAESGRWRTGPRSTQATCGRGRQGTCDSSGIVADADSARSQGSGCTGTSRDSIAIAHGSHWPVAEADSASGKARRDTGPDSQRLRVQPVGLAAPSADADGRKQGPQPRGDSAPLDRRRTWDPGTEPRRPAVDDPIAWGKYAPAIDRWEHLTRPAPEPTVPGRNGRPRLSPTFVEWMMGLPEGHVTGHGLSNAQALKMLGNGVVPQQAEMALRLLLGGAA